MHELRIHQRLQLEIMGHLHCKWPITHAIRLQKRATSDRRRGHEKRTASLGQLGAFSPGYHSPCIFALGGDEVVKGTSFTGC